GQPWRPFVSRERDLLLRLAALTQLTDEEQERLHQLEPLPDGVVSVTAGELYAAYDDNEVSADRLYRGKQLMVSGVISGIDKDALDDVIVRLRGPSAFQSVMAKIRSSDESSAATLSKGNGSTFCARARSASSAARLWTIARSVEAGPA
ncbi:MAG TPA: hypothetical protein VHB97_15455, partial [Polyangia bacterium]|nr:hypothetical protein [Polyangia bacterium]